MQLRPIVLAEDDPLDALLTLRALRALSIANRIVHLTNGKSVLDYVYKQGEFLNDEEEEPSFIILDIKMPYVDGIEVLNHLKADKTKNHIPVIMLTSSSEIKDVVKCYGEGANSYVVKPVGMKQFEDAVKHLGLYWALVNKPKE